MEENRYDVWALRIREAIHARQEGKAPRNSSSTVKELLLVLAFEAAAVVGAIGRNIDEVEIQGADRSDAMEGFLDQMLKFQEFAFIEYRYKVSSRKQPGIRFKAENTGAADPRVVVHYFRDLVFWDVDEQGNRIFFEPVRFDLTEGKIRAFPHPDLRSIYAGCTTWQAALRETLALPLRFLFDPREYPML
ncbi:MAG: hypothetical protein C4576_15560 [Desulfobacteraceae bacterium]|nr:MAG: hypothetical protein C4576_15560 [Desulfobacteraceae bacterium]